MPTQNVSETQRITASGTVVDQYEVVFQIPGRETVVTFRVDRTGDVIADAQRIRDQIEREIDALFAL